MHIFANTSIFNYSTNLHILLLIDTVAEAVLPLAIYGFFTQLCCTEPLSILLFSLYYFALKV